MTNQTTAPRLYDIYNPDACPAGIPDTFCTLATSETAAAAAYARLLESRGIAVAALAQWNHENPRRWALSLADGPDAPDTLYIDPADYGTGEHAGWTNRYTWCVARLAQNDTPETLATCRRHAREGAARFREYVARVWLGSGTLKMRADAIGGHGWRLNALSDCIPCDESWDLMSESDRRALIVFMLDAIDWPAIVANLLEGDEDDTPADDDATDPDADQWDPDALAAALVARSWTQDAADEAAALLCAAFLSGDLHDLAAAIVATVPAP